MCDDLGRAQCCSPLCKCTFNSANWLTQSLTDASNDGIQKANRAHWKRIQILQYQTHHHHYVAQMQLKTESIPRHRKPSGKAQSLGIPTTVWLYPWMGNGKGITLYPNMFLYVYPLPLWARVRGVKCYCDPTNEKEAGHTALILLVPPAGCMPWPYIDLCLMLVTTRNYTQSVLQPNVSVGVSSVRELAIINRSSVCAG